jgi:protein-tyrosine phosphatase
MNREVVSIDESYWVIPDTFRAGRYPAAGEEIETRKKLRWLLKQGINFIIDLTEEGEAESTPYLKLLQDEAKKNRLNIIYQRIPIQDFSTPSTERITQILDEIDAAINKGKHIYLHCQGGKGRTGLLVGCYLARHGDQGQRALVKLQSLRKKMPGGKESSPETEGQVRMVLEWKQGQ